MSLRIYLDECACAKQMVALLRNAGHEVTTPADAGTSEKADPAHFLYAATNGLVLVTKNPKDFEKLHEQNQSHSGILVIYQDNDPSRDMSYAEIVRAIGNIESAGIQLAGTLQVLNAWRY